MSHEEKKTWLATVCYFQRFSITWVIFHSIFQDFRNILSHKEIKVDMGISIVELAVEYKKYVDDYK